MLDQSQRPAEPTPSHKLSDVVRIDAGSRVETQIEEANRLKALSELAFIESLKTNPAFAWFWSEFVAKPFKASRDAFGDEHLGDEAMPKVRARYLALKEIRSALIRREINHLRNVHPKSADLQKLMAELDTL